MFAPYAGVRCRFTHQEDSRCSNPNRLAPTNLLHENAAR